MPAEYDYLRGLLRERSGLVLAADKQYLAESRLLPIACRFGFKGLAGLIRKHGVTLWNSVPMFVQLFLEGGRAAAEALQGVRLVMMSGDWIPLDLPPRLRQANPAIELVSMGGATEASIWSIAYAIGAPEPAWASVPYGYPMRNQRFHVLDEQMKDSPDWVAGELYIAGEGLARGYWRDPSTTAARCTRTTTGPPWTRRGRGRRFRGSASTCSTSRV